MIDSAIHPARQADVIEVTPAMQGAGAWALLSVADGLVGHLSLERVGEFAVEVYVAMEKSRLAPLPVKGRGRTGKAPLGLQI